MDTLHKNYKFRTLPFTDQSSSRLRATTLIFALFLLNALPAQADYKNDVGYTALESELGLGIPDGAGVSVSHVEGAVTVNGIETWMPNPGNGEFTNKTITDVSGNGTAVYSGHATSVGKDFYGNTISTSPGITTIAAYNVNHWLTSAFLRLNTGGAGQPPQPLSTADRIGNHSWAGSAGSFDLDILTRTDWIIARDEMIQTTGGPTAKLLSGAYNVIAVDPTFFAATGGSANIGGLYTSGRTKPDIVAPATSSSNATPRIASAAALLISAAHNNPSWSTDPLVTSTTNRVGNTIYNAERAEIIKAALMAGADRETSNTTSIDITDYRTNAVDQTNNGLDRRYGAGQLNIYNSYHVVAAGEQNSIEDQASGSGLIGSTGFDYDPAYGGANGSNAAATYYFSPTTSPAQLTASLVWNIAIDGGSSNNFDGTATLYDLDLQLFDVTDSANWVLVGSSTSTNQNTENLWQLLDGGKNYALQVKSGAGQTSFEWDYGLAWQLTAIQPVVPLVIDPVVLPAVYLNATYSPQTLTASNGQPPLTWAVINGALPSGMTLSVDGVISGIPATLGLSYFTVQVTDMTANTATLELQINVKFSGYVCGNCHSAPGS